MQPIYLSDYEAIAEQRIANERVEHSSITHALVR